MKHHEFNFGSHKVFVNISNLPACILSAHVVRYMEIKSFFYLETHTKTWTLHTFTYDSKHASTRSPSRRALHSLLGWTHVALWLLATTISAAVDGTRRGRSLMGKK